MEVNEIAWSFIAEWFDPHPQLTRSFILTYHSYSNEIEMKDRTTNRKYLKRTKLPTKLLHSDFTIGAYIVIFSRNLKIGTVNVTFSCASFLRKMRNTKLKWFSSYNTPSL